MASKCCRCGEEPEGHILLAIVMGYERPYEIEKQVCMPCAQAINTRFREWCGEDKPSSSPWLAKGWP